MRANLEKVSENFQNVQTAESLTQGRFLGQYLSISEETFWDIIDRHRNREIFTKDSSGNWKFKIAIK